MVLAALQLPYCRTEAKWGNNSLLFRRENDLRICEDCEMDVGWEMWSHNVEIKTRLANFGFGMSLKEYRASVCAFAWKN